MHKKYVYKKYVYMIPIEMIRVGLLFNIFVQGSAKFAQRGVGGRPNPPPL